MSALDRRIGAVALAYEVSDPAPRVVAKGWGETAHAIIAQARAHGIPVHSSPELLALLVQVDFDRTIPPALYRAVAELLAWVHRIECGQGKENR